MNGIDFWRLCDEFTIVQAALLIAGFDPSEDQEYVESWPPEKRPTGYDAIRAALYNAIVGGRLKAQIVEATEMVTHDWTGEHEYLTEAVKLGYPDVKRTVIAAEDISAFLKARGFREGFFSDIDRPKAASIDPGSQFYAPKLAAAIEAWTVVTSQPELLNGKTPKQALKIWLRKHSDKFGLSKEDGNPNEQGIEDICKVANWKPEGGASTTPVKKEKSDPSTVATPKGAPPSLDLDGDIPF